MTEAEQGVLDLHVLCPKQSRWSCVSLNVPPVCAEVRPWKLTSKSWKWISQGSWIFKSLVFGFAHYRMHSSLWLRCLWAMYCQINTNKWHWFMSYQPSVILDDWCSLGVVWVAPLVQLLEAVCTLLVALFPLWEGEETIPEAWTWLLNFCSLSSLLLFVILDMSHEVTY